ncbi:hypothetical protein V9L05_12405 [Bernardetia sp. Wsw4-3y2]|uniref:hypothetical protein n=1 Tax=Bernardetia sp. Wsw4-3y2 TaxID=3127471 RepID=UPI0030CF25BD
MKKLGIILLLLFYSNVVLGQIDSLKLSNVEKLANDLEAKIEKLESSKVDKEILEKVYDKEKELLKKSYDAENNTLKETYSSNYSYIQIIITLIFGLFTVLSYFGFRSVSNLKKEYKDKLKDLETQKNSFENDYKAKLDELKALKTNFDNDYDDFNTKRIEIDERIEKVELESSERNKKLEILELTEKVLHFEQIPNYYLAISYAEIGLELEPNDFLLLHYHSKLNILLREYKKAKESLNNILNYYPKKNNVATIYNLAEIYLLTDDIEGYEKHRDKYRDAILHKADLRAIFIRSFYFYTQDNEKGLIMQIGNFFKFGGESRRHNLKGIQWEFPEVKGYIYEKGRKNQTEKIFETFVKYLDMDSSVDKQTLIDLTKDTPA